jgi:hypothetical protein
MSFNNHKIIPTFIGVGQQKSATTWLSEILRTHPEVFVTIPKETDFFSVQWNKGIAWYEQLYANSESYKVRGEYSVSYLTHPEALTRIKQIAGNPKILISIRNPVDRFVSNLKHLYNRGKISEKNIDMKLYATYIKQHPELITFGFFTQHIQSFIENFGEDHVLVLLKEHIDQHPQAVAARIYEFLDVDPTFISEYLHISINQGSVTKYKRLESFLIALFRWFNKHFPKFVHFLRKNKIIDFVRRILRSGNEIKINQEVIAELERVFDKEIKQLNHLVDNGLAI